MTRLEEAIAIAAEYNWAPEMPDAVKQMRQGIIPEGFGRLVGQTIALFLTRPVIGPSPSGWHAFACSSPKSGWDATNNPKRPRC